LSINSAASSYKISKQLFADRKYLEAFNSFKEIARDYPDFFPIFLELGLWHERRKEFDQSIPYFLRANELNPHHHRVNLGLGLYYRHTGDFIKAKTFYKKAIELKLFSKQIDRSTIIQNFINAKGYTSYLEIGVEKGNLFLQIDVPYKAAVEPNFLIPGGFNNIKGSEEYYEMTSNDFFNSKMKKSPKEFDIVFIDGLHTYEQSRQDLENSLKYLSPNGVVLLHDCNPESETAALPSIKLSTMTEGFSGAWMGDVYKTMIWAKTHLHDFDVFTLDCDCGIGVVSKSSKIKKQNVISLSETKIKELTYDELEKNKGDYLNLYAADFISEYIES